MKKLIQSLKGTRDFYPEEMAMRTFLYNSARKVSEAFGYQEYDSPFLEPIDLYAAKSGEELVKEQSFVFSDRGGDLITLRPELTPSLARMVAQRQRQLAYPLRWWSWGPMWRYEKPQKGRSREFFQWNIDLIGVDSPEADAEIVAIAASFFQTIGLTSQDVRILVNNRKLIDAEMDALEIPLEKRLDVSNWIDRRQKMSPQEWEAYGLEIGLNRAQLDGMQTTLSNPELWKKSKDLCRLFEALGALGFADYVAYDANTVRGLLYYTGTVFEAVDQSGDVRRAVLGGGRYDNLVSDVGGEPVEAVGFAMGDVVISLVLEKLKRFPTEIFQSPARVLVTVFDEASMAASLALSAQLRNAGLKVAMYPENAKLAKQIKYADRMGMRLAIIQGPDERQANLVTIKDLSSGVQRTAQQKEAAKIVAEMLATKPSS